MIDITPAEIQELTVTEIEGLIADASDNDRELLKAQIRQAEQADGSPRQGVLDATEPVTAPAPPAEAAQTPPAPDENDERPDAATAAEELAAAEDKQLAAAADNGQVSLADPSSFEE